MLVPGKGEAGQASKGDLITMLPLKSKISRVQLLLEINLATR